MKRFWDTAAASRTPDGFTILLDRRPMHLPDGAILHVRSSRLADAIAAEWQAAGAALGGEMSFADTPLTRLAGTAQQRVASDPASTIDAIARYGENDLLCYRAIDPPALVQRQAREWQPWLDWAALTHDAPLRVTSGIAPIRQHRDAVAALRRAVAALEPEVLAALGIAVPALGSLVLGLALADGRLDAAAAHTLGALDELFQAEQWGEDADAATRRSAIAADIALAARFIALSKGEPA
ncbi:MAG TPA: ATP12 family protein [Acetobacteraceae bacterium]|nr:ATP12 family protein [Acetobacteraceae bacterium]